MNKDFNLLKMLKEQEDLDKEFEKKEGRPRDMTEEGNLVALQVEIFEATQSAKKYWNYWKNNCKFDKNDFLEEMSDVLHFFLTFIRLKGNLQDIERKIEAFKTETFLKALEEDTEDSVFEKRPSLEFSILNLAKFEFTGTYVKSISTFNIFVKFIYITNIFKYLGCTWEEFLEIHYKKYEKNMKERTKEEY